MGSEDPDRRSNQPEETPAGDWFEKPEEVWERPDTPRRAGGVDAGVIPFDDIHFHRYCDILPVRLADPPPGTDGDRGWADSIRELPGRIRLFPPDEDTRAGRDEVIRYLPARSDERSPEEEPGALWFLRGTVRTALQYTPVMVAVVAAVFLVSAEYSSSVQGIGVFVASFPPVLIPAGVAGAVLWAILGYLIVDAGLVEARELVKVATVFGLVGLLLLGTVGSIFLVLAADDPRALPPNIIYTSGYLLVVLVGGLLTYDGMLRTEYMFNNLSRTLVVDEEDEGTYDRYREKLARQLSDRTPLPVVGEVPTYSIFSVLLVSQFAAVWALAGTGPQNLSFHVTFVGNVLIDLVMAIIYFQMFVLIKGFHDLVTGQVRLDEPGGDDSGQSVTDGGEDGSHDLLSYRPFHPDGRGGFRDFGKFATRVNVLLILGGFYVTYRLYVQGARSLPGGGAELGTDPTLAMLAWVINYVGPVLVLLVLGLAWLYYSFWTLHVKMAREREELYTEYLVKQREGSETTSIGSFEDALEWHERREPAPVWPIDTRLLASLVSSTLIPMVLALPRILF